MTSILAKPSGEKGAEPRDLERFGDILGAGRAGEVYLRGLAVGSTKQLSGQGDRRNQAKAWTVGAGPTIRPWKMGEAGIRH